jgi:hypothetical protein
MSHNRTDLLPECNQKAAPLDLFVAECCLRCINPECTRSQFGKSRFDARVQNWFERLFENVPKMSPQDPRFALFADKKFLTLDTSRPIEVNTSTWFDPRDLEASPAPRVSAPPVVAPEPEAQGVAPTPSVLSRPPSPSGSKVLPSHMILANTSMQQDQMVGKHTLPATPRDNWSGPVSMEPATGSDKPSVVVKTGATVKLNGSGV